MLGPFLRAGRPLQEASRRENPLRPNLCRMRALGSGWGGVPVNSYSSRSGRRGTDPAFWARKGTGGSLGTLGRAPPAGAPLGGRILGSSTGDRSTSARLTTGPRTPLGPVRSQRPGDSIWGSLQQFPLWEMKFGLCEQRLLVSITTPKVEDAPGVMVQIDLTADQTMGPSRIGGEAATKERDVAVGIAAPDVDQPSPRRELGIERPACGNMPACEGTIPAGSPTGGIGVDGAPGFGPPKTARTSQDQRPR